jgi:hypothetical protein
MPFMLMNHEVDPKQKLLDELGDISGLKLFNNQVLAAVYIRPEKTKSGLVLASQTREEDRYQSKVGLIIHMGPSAFKDPTGQWFEGVDVGLHDWIVFRPSDTWSLTVNNVLCRVVDDDKIRGQVAHPDQAY